MLLYVFRTLGHMIFWQKIPNSHIFGFFTLFVTNDKKDWRCSISLELINEIQNVCIGCEIDLLMPIIGPLHWQKQHNRAYSVKAATNSWEEEVLVVSFNIDIVARPPAAFYWNGIHGTKQTTLSSLHSLTLPLGQ